MPAREPIILPDGWQVVKRGDGWWLQRRIVGSELWIDVYGPAKQRVQAVRIYERRENDRVRRMSEAAEIAAELTPLPQEAEKEQER